MKFFCLLALTAATVKAATVSVSAGSSIGNAITSASPGDTLILGPGQHPVSSSLVINKNLKIQAADNTTVLVPAADVPFIFSSGTNGLKIEISGVSVKHRTANTQCKLETPFALQGNFSLEILNPNVRNGNINLEANLGTWYENRYVSNVLFGNCSYATDGDWVGNPSPKLSGYSWVLYSDTCKSSVFFSLKFDKIGNCGVKIDKTTDPKFVRYLASIEATMSEYVSRINPTKNLRIPIDRVGNAAAKLRVQINREGTVSATISVSYAEAELQAVISKLDIKAVDGVNTSTVTILVNLPAPYTVLGTSPSGAVTLSQMNIPSANASNFIGTGACDNLANNAVCNTTLTFNITSCDLTGQYLIANLPIGCQASSNAAGTCPTITQNTADVNFFISTNNFCNITEFNLSSLFTLDVVLRTDQNYNVTREETIYNLGESSYWSILIWTNSSGVGLSRADVTAFERTSNGDCSTYDPPYADITTMEQTFRGNLVPPEIQLPIPVTAGISCAAANNTSNDIVLTWTVLVDYLDTSARRRRREVEFSRNRRDSGELQTQKAFGTKYTAEDFAAATSPTKEQPTSSNSTMYIIVSVISVVALLFCCCCCAGIGFFLWRRNQRMQLKERNLGQSGLESHMSLNQPNSNYDINRSHM